MSASIARVGLYTVALLATLGAAEAPLWALAPVDVPEINSSSLTAGLGLLAAGILILRSRRRPR
jgi:MYXO-CTERM domain-containing protein